MAGWNSPSTGIINSGWKTGNEVAPGGQGNEKLVTATLCFNIRKVRTDPMMAPTGYVDLLEKILKIYGSLNVAGNIIPVSAESSEIFYEKDTGQRVKITDDEGVKGAMSMDKPNFQLQLELQFNQGRRQNAPSQLRDALQQR